MRICLLGYRSHPFSGGQGIYIKYLSKALADAGHQVDVISGEPYPELDDRVKLIKLPGLNLFEAPSHVMALRPRHLLSFTDTFEWWSMLTGGFAEPYTFGRRLVRFLDKSATSYDVIHDNQSLCYGLLELQQQGYPVISTVHHPITSDRALALASAVNLRSKLLILRWHTFLHMQTRVIRQLDHIVTVSQQSRKDIADAFSIDADSIHLVHNGVDVDVFKPLTDICRKPCQLITTASADVPLKGLEYLLRALVPLREKYASLSLLIVGKIKEDGAISKLIKSLKIGDMLTFVSNISTGQLVSYYAESTLAVVPSLYEGFGLPAAEAMATGTPIVSTRGGALPEVVGDAGILIPTHDDAALVTAITCLLDDEEQRDRLGEKGRQHIINNFNWDLCASQMLDLYKEVISHAHAHH